MASFAFLTSSLVRSQQACRLWERPSVRGVRGLWKQAVSPQEQRSLHARLSYGWGQGIGCRLRAWQGGEACWREATFESSARGH